MARSVKSNAESATPGDHSDRRRQAGSAALREVRSEQALSRFVADKPRLLIVGDQPLYRSALGSLIEQSNEFTVTGECAADPDAIKTALLNDADVVVIDFDLINVYGDQLERFERLLSCCAPRPVLILSAGLDPGPCQAALRHGIAGIVLKHHGGDVLLEAIDNVRRGQVWLDRPLLSRMFTEAEEPPGGASGDRGKIKQLTPREREIVEVACTGLTNKQIAGKLSISEATVRHHLGSIFSKLGVSTRSELVVYGYRHKLCRPPGM